MIASSEPTLDLASLRQHFPILEEQINGKRLVYLDNAAATQKPVSVLSAVDEFYRHSNANVHRGIHELSNRATEAYEGARHHVASFFGVSDSKELLWTRGTTEGLNLVANCWGGSVLKPGDEIVLSVMEHHSNLVPWQLVAARTGASLRFIDIDEQGRLDPKSLDEVLSHRTRIVAVAHVSNALGTINPIAEIGARAHEVGAVLVVDGAQSAPHLPVSVEELECDFYAFSGQKMCGPTGTGALWGKREHLERMPPWMGGGDMIDRVELEQSTWAPLPAKFEAGTPNIAGAVGLGAAVDFLSSVGRQRILEHEQDLVGYALERLSAIPEIRIFGPTDPAERSGVISFTLGDVHPHDLATILDAQGIAIRAGHHCAQPLMRRLGVGATARVSFYLYNERSEVDVLVDALTYARSIFSR
jgi:cysteine desulfurase/selenocysteine lyase